MTRRSGRTLVLLFALSLGAGTAAGRLLADEPPAAGAGAEVKEAAKEGARAAAPKTTGAMDALVQQMKGSKPAIWAFALIQIGGAAVGLGLLLRSWLRLEARQGAAPAGLVPPPPASPPTRPFRIGSAIGLFLLAAAAPTLLLSIVMGITGERPGRLLDRLPLALAIQTAAGLPFVWLIVRRRAQLAPSRPAFPRTTVIGLWTWAVALAVVVPAALLSFFGLQALGHPPAPQELVEIAVDRSTPDWLPWLILGYGVLLAPVIEESLFRGLLYPTIRSAAGGGRRGVWAGVLVTALLFAAIHQNVSSLLPLFVLAIVLALVFERTNSLAGVTIAHGLFNLGSFVPLLLARFS